MAKKEEIEIEATCRSCDYHTTYKLVLNEHGFYSGLIGFCPNDFMQLYQVFKEKK